jgi:hypothetical protein
MMGAMPVMALIGTVMVIVMAPRRKAVTNRLAFKGV